MSLVSCNNDEHKLIWVYLGLVFDKALLMGDVDIYLCLVFLFTFRILRTTLCCFVLDWSEPQSDKIVGQIILMPVTVSHF